MPHWFPLQFCRTPQTVLEVSDFVDQNVNLRSSSPGPTQLATTLSYKRWWIYEADSVHRSNYLSTFLLYLSCVTLSLWKMVNVMGLNNGII